MVNVRTPNGFLNSQLSLEGVFINEKNGCNMNKRGWIKIVEAFIAIMLIAGVLLIVINKGYIGKSDISSKVYKIQLAVLREIELDDGLRGDILTAVLGEDNIPNGVQNKISNRIPKNLECKAKICELDKICALDSYNTEKDVYAQSVAIVATLQNYDPRQLKLFCWVK